VILARINEQTTAKFWATLQDEDGQIVPASALSSVLLTLYDAATRQRINNRDKQAVLNQNDVAVYDTLQHSTDEAGNPITYNLLWQLQPADNSIVRTSRAIELHAFEFVYQWGTGKQASYSGVVEVVNMDALAN
jgi:hypothetical protein